MMSPKYDMDILDAIARKYILEDYEINPTSIVIEVDDEDSRMFCVEFFDENGGFHSFSVYKKFFKETLQEVLNGW